MKIFGFEVQVSDFLDQVWFDEEKGIVHLEYCERRLAVIERNKLIREGYRRVTPPTQIKDENNWEITLPHPNWTVLNTLPISECTPKNAWGPKDTLQKHTFGQIIKQEKTEEELLKQEKRFNSNRNLKARDIEERTFLHQALAEPYYGPSRQYSLGVIPDLQEQQPKSTIPGVRLPSSSTTQELLEVWLQIYPEYRR